MPPYLTTAGAADAACSRLFMTPANHLHCKGTHQQCRQQGIKFAVRRQSASATATAA